MSKGEYTTGRRIFPEEPCPICGNKVVFREFMSRDPMDIFAPLYYKMHHIGTGGKRCRGKTCFEARPHALLNPQCVEEAWTEFATTYDRAKERSCENCRHYHDKDCRFWRWNFKTKFDSCCNFVRWE